MAIDFLGAMFKGIGDTFTAGASVHNGLMNERNIQRQLAFDRESLAAMDEQGLLSFLMSKKQQETTLIIVVMVAILLILGLLIFFRKKK